MFTVSNLKYFDRLTILICTIIIILFCDVVIMFYLRKLWQFKDHNVFKKRYAYITMIEGLMFIAQSVFYVIRIVIIVFYNGTLISPLFTAFMGFFWMFLRRILYCCLLWRFWMLLFEMSLTQIALNKKWMNIIDPKSEISSWFISHKSTFGNFYFMRKVTILLVIFVTMFDIIPYRFVPIIFDIDPDWKLTLNIFNWIWNVMLPLGLLIIFLILPPIRDNFYVSKEIKYLVILAMSELIFVILYYIALYYDWMSSNDLLLFLLSALYVGDAWIVYIATCWVYNKVKHIIKWDLLVETNMDESNLAKKSVQQSSDNGDNSSKLNEQLISQNSSIQKLYSDLLNTTKNEQLLQKFVEYILMDLFINEWVAFIEVIQFMQYIVQFMSQHHMPIRIILNPLYEMVQFPTNIPSSSIVFEANKKDNAVIDEYDQKECKDDEIQDLDSFLMKCKHITYKLYKKYFDFGAHYEVRHVPDSIKADLDGSMQHKDDFFEENTIDLQWTLDKMHESATHICVALLQSFYRYQLDRIKTETL